MSNTTLTPEQLKNLLLNAYGFVDKFNILYSCHESLIEEGIATIQDINGDTLDIDLNGEATLLEDSLVLTVATKDGDVEFLTALVPLSQARDLENYLE